MNKKSAVAIAHPNIAFIKFWGFRDKALNIPTNSSISMNLEDLFTQTEVTFNPKLRKDQLVLNKNFISKGPQYNRVVSFLDVVRSKAQMDIKATVISKNNFPFSAGIASSASAFAALALAASKAAGLSLSEKELSRLARLGSGSASRSIPEGFVEWNAGSDDVSSYAYSIASPNHWHLTDLIVIVDPSPKKISSAEGHEFAASSPLQEARILDAERRLAICRQAILQKDFDLLAQIAELDSNIMHAVTMTSNPPIFYWKPATLVIVQTIQGMRNKGIPVFYTIDAGPNVHTLTLPEYAEKVRNLLAEIPEVINIHHSGVGGSAKTLYLDAK